MYVDRTRRLRPATTGEEPARIDPYQHGVAEQPREPPRGVQVQRHMQRATGQPVLAARGWTAPEATATLFVPIRNLSRIAPAHLLAAE
jgi:hypothetical protein